jgi:hypothetical protein
MLADSIAPIAKTSTLERAARSTATLAMLLAITKVTILRIAMGRKLQATEAAGLALALAMPIKVIITRKTIPAAKCKVILVSTTGSVADPEFRPYLTFRARNYFFWYPGSSTVNFQMKFMAFLTANIYCTSLLQSEEELLSLSFSLGSGMKLVAAGFAMQSF